MAFWKSNDEPNDFKYRTTLARIEGKNLNLGNSAASALLAIGFVAMLIEVVFDTSAVRLAAWGAIWTGWNVLWGIGVLSGEGKVTYIVYQETTEPHVDSSVPS